jgi:WD40 repeat protein
VAASRDGRYVIAGGSIGSTILRDLVLNTTAVLPSRGVRQSVSAVAFNQSGTLCGSGSFDGDVTVWDVQKHEIFWSRDMGDIIKCLAFLGDGDRLLTGTLDRNGTPLRLWDLRHGNELRLDPGGVRMETVRDLVVSPAGDRFVSVGAYSTSSCQLWDALTGRRIAELTDPTGDLPLRDNPPPQQAAFSADGSLLAVVRSRFTLHDGRTGALRRRVDAGSWHRVHCVELCDDGSASLVTDTGHSTVLRRMTPDLNVWEDITMDKPGNPAESISFTASGLVLTGRMTNTLRLLQPPPLVLPHADLGADFATAQVAVSGDGSRIATLTFPVYTRPSKEQSAEERRRAMTSRLQLWDARTLCPVSRIAELSDDYVPNTIAYGPTANSLAVGSLELGGKAPVLIATMAPNGAIDFDRLGAHAASVGALAFTPDGKRLLTGSGPSDADGRGELICWDLTARSAFPRKVLYPAAITALAVSPDGTHLVIGGTDGVIRLWSLEPLFGVLSEFDVGDKVSALAFAHQAPLVAVTHFTDRVRVFEVANGALLPRPPCPFNQLDGAFSAVAFSTDDDVLYVKGADGVQRWDMGSMRRLDPVITFFDSVQTFALNPRPQSVIAVTYRGKMILRGVLSPGPSGPVVGPRPALVGSS